MSSPQDLRARPRFSVVIPALDEADTIGACLASLLAQDTPGDIEIIVADNNSTDTTAQVAHSFGVVVVHAAEPGVCSARQCGTERARGEIIVSADADTTYEPGWLAGIDAYFLSHPTHTAVGGPCTFDDGPAWSSVYTTLLFGTVHRIHRLTGRTVYVSATNLAFRREAWTGYNVTLTQGGDELAILHSLRRQGPVGFVMGHPSHTSARRMTNGFLYSVVVTCLYYYLLGYAVNSMAGRTVIGTAPPFRPHGRPSRRGLYACATVVGSVAVTWLGRELI